MRNCKANDAGSAVFIPSNWHIEDSFVCQGVTAAAAMLVDVFHNFDISMAKFVYANRDDGKGLS